MHGSLLLYLAVFTVAAMGQDAVPVKARDRAPEIDFTGVVQSPSSSKFHPSLTGQYTVLRFLPITPNTKAIGRWNDLIAEFADRPVQFVWITSENKAAVQTFLGEHPIEGWLLIDEKNQATRAYGCEMGDEAIVDPSGVIVGFTIFVDELLSSVLDGKALALPRDMDDDRVFELLAGGKVRLDSEPQQFPPPGSVREPAKPDIPPSYEVHISPSDLKGNEQLEGPDYWVARGLDLKTIVSRVYEKDEGRVVLPKALDNNDLFDFVLVLPKQENQETMYGLVRHAIERYFRVSVTVESKPVEAYVMTAIAGKTPPAKTGHGGFVGGFSSSAISFPIALPAGTQATPEAMRKAMQELMQHPENIGIANISAGNMTMDDFGRELERSLGRPVIDETGLAGVYDIEVYGNAKNNEEFIGALREQAGLVLTPATRNIEFLVLRSLN